MTENIVSILSDAKAEDIKVIDLSNKSSVADAFVIATCRSTRHSDATADEMVKKLKKLGIKCPNPEGRPQCDWIIVDAGEIITTLLVKTDSKNIVSVASEQTAPNIAVTP